MSLDLIVEPNYTLGLDIWSLIGAVRHQTITWANFDLDLHRHMAPQGHDNYIPYICTSTKCHFETMDDKIARNLNALWRMLCEAQWHPVSSGDTICCWNQWYTLTSKSTQRTVLTEYALTSYTYFANQHAIWSLNSCGIHTYGWYWPGASFTNMV